MSSVTFVLWGHVRLYQQQEAAHPSRNFLKLSSSVQVRSAGETHHQPQPAQQVAASPGFPAPTPQQTGSKTGPAAASHAAAAAVPNHSSATSSIQPSAQLLALQDDPALKAQLRPNASSQKAQAQGDAAEEWQTGSNQSTGTPLVSALAVDQLANGGQIRPPIAEHLHQAAVIPQASTGPNGQLLSQPTADMRMAERPSQQLQPKASISFQQLMSAADAPADASESLTVATEPASVTAAHSAPQPKLEAAEPIPGLPSSYMRPANVPLPQRDPQTGSLTAVIQSGPAAPAAAAAAYISATRLEAPLPASHYQEDEIIDIAADDELPDAGDPDQAAPAIQPSGKADSASRRTITGGAHHPRIASWQPSPDPCLGSQEAYGLWGSTPYNPPYPHGHADPATTSGWTVTSNWPNPQASTQSEHTGWATAYPDMQALIRNARSAQPDAGFAAKPSADHQSSDPSIPHDVDGHAQPAASSAPHAPSADIQMDGDDLMADGPWAEEFERFMAANLDGQPGASSRPRQEAAPSLPHAEQHSQPECNGWAWPPGDPAPPHDPEPDRDTEPLAVRFHPMRCCPCISELLVLSPHA